MSNHFCPECGSENKANSSFCGYCGSELVSPSDLSNEDAGITLRLHGGDLDAGQDPSVIDTDYTVCAGCGHPNGQNAVYCGKCGAHLGVAPAVVPAEERGHQPGKANLRIPLIAGAMALSIIIGIAGAYYFLSMRNGASADSDIPVAKQSQDFENGTDAGTSNSTQTGSSTKSNLQISNYFASLDPLVGRNSTLEQQVVTTAGDINRVAPDGIDSSLLSRASNIENDLRSLRQEANALNPPASCAQSQQDFLQLIDYNITRADALYRGAVAWRGHDPNYTSIFLDGQHAKDAYYRLNPQFDSECRSLKAGI